MPVVADRDEKKVERLAERGIARAREERRNVVIIDTAGRLHIDDEMMAELERSSPQPAPTKRSSSPTA